MGSSSTKQQIQKINPSEWTKIRVENGTQIARNTKSSSEGEIRVIGLDPKHEIAKQKSIYTYRKNTDVPLVRALGVDFQKSENKTLCGNQQNVKVLTERIPHRLDTVRNFSEPEALYVLSEALAGFQDLHAKAGVFDITEKMVGFNRDGQVRVWLNENFAQNHPVSQRPILQTTMTAPESFQTGVSAEQRMIETLTHLIQNKTPQKRLPAELDNALSSKGKTFVDAYNCVEGYIKDKRVAVPDRIDFNAQVGQGQGYGEDFRATVGNTVASNLVSQYNSGGMQSMGSQNNTGGVNRVSNTTNIQQPYTNTSTNPPQYQYSSYTPTPSPLPLSLPISNHIQTTSTIIPPLSFHQQPQPQSQPSTQYTSYLPPLSPRNHHTTTYSTVNFTSGHSYGMTQMQMQEPYQYGVVSRPLSPRFGASRAVSFNYQSPRGAADSSRVLRQY